MQGLGEPWVRRTPNPDWSAPLSPRLKFFFLSLRLCVLRNPTTSMPTTHTSCILISSLVVSGYCPPQLSIDNTPSFM